MLSSTHPAERYDSTRTIVTRYGKTDDGGVSIGSLDLLGIRGEVKPLIPLHTGTAMAGTGEAKAEDAVDMPPYSQDLVIMNPPFTRAGSDWEGDARETDYVKPFRGLSTDLETQKRMSKLKTKYARGTCSHGYAGLASTFAALADRMVKNDGKLALVLPMTALQGSSWLKFRQMIAKSYREVIAITIAADKAELQSFSADTDLAETLIICRQSARGADRRGMFVCLDRRPSSEMEATELARAICEIAGDPSLSTLENGPMGGTWLQIGDERLGEVIDAPLSLDLPWSAAGVSDLSLMQSIYQLSRGKVWLPQMSAQQTLDVPMSTVDEICDVGFHDANIVGDGSQTAFTRIKTVSETSTYPMLWSHDNQSETRLVVEPDSQGRIKRGRKARAADIWATRSHAHHNRDFGFGSQPLGVAFTRKRTIGGRAWPNVKFESRAEEKAYSLWGNSTFGLMCYWYHSSRQQTGRGLMPVSAIRTMPFLDTRRLSDVQLNTVETIFDDMANREFLPANEAWRDGNRKELDRRVLIEMLRLPESVLEPLELLRLKWCSEPSVHAGKSTAPPSV